MHCTRTLIANHDVHLFEYTTCALRISSIQFQYFYVDAILFFSFCSPRKPLLLPPLHLSIYIGLPLSSIFVPLGISDRFVFVPNLSILVQGDPCGFFSFRFPVNILFYLFISEQDHSILLLFKQTLTSDIFGITNSILYNTFDVAHSFQEFSFFLCFFSSLTNSCFSII